MQPTVNIDEALGQPEVYLSAIATHHAHDVLEPECGDGERMVLGHGDVDDLVRLEGVPVQLPFLQHEGSGNGGPDEFPVLGVVDADGIRGTIPLAERLDRRPDAAVHVTAPRLVAGAVEHAD